VVNQANAALPITKARQPQRKAGVTEFVQDERVKICVKKTHMGFVESARKDVLKISSIGQGDDVDLVTGCSKVFDQFLVVEIAAGGLV